MRCNKVSRSKRVCGKPRSSKKKKKAHSKASRTPKNRRPTLLLRNIQNAPGKRIRKKSCTRCQEVKWLSEFYLSNKTGRGLSYKSECKDCFNRITTERKRALRKKIKNAGGNPLYQEYQREYYKKNRDKFVEYRRKRNEKFPDYFKIKSKERRQRLRAQELKAKEALTDRDCR